MDLVPASLTADQERELVLQYKAGSSRAGERLLREHRVLIAIAVRHYRCGIELADARQEASLALLHAATKFEPERGRFAPFALPVLRNHLRAVAPALRRTIRGTRHADRKAFAAANGGAPLPAWLRPSMSLDAPIDGASEGKRTVGDRLVDETKRPDYAVEIAEFTAKIPAAIAELDGYAPEALRLRFWEGLTLDEVAPIVGKSRETVRTRELVSLRRMRRYFETRPMRNSGGGQIPI